MNALVISGGGSKGAFAGGIAEYLINTKKNQYDIFVGSSVGSLLISQLAINNIDKIKKTFTSISNSDIFNISPFIVNKKEEIPSIRINHFNTLRAFLKGCNTFGESKNLRKLIEKVHSESEFDLLKKSKKVFFTVSNLTENKVEYIDASTCTYNDYCDWMWASANYVPFMSLMTKNGKQYADGGFACHVPVLQAINNGATNIDVIILDEEINENITHPAYNNPFQSLMGVFTFMTNQIALKDILITKLEGRQSQIDIKFWYPPKNITNNPLYFNSKLMTKWWDDGYERAKTTPPICYCFMDNGDLKIM
ncbi:MAG: patatin-like phospholipase family protein [Vicingaceae bacterium]|nr:patatin-like phospholipase family protein [Vicingaceae bacterium]